MTGTDRDARAELHEQVRRRLDTRLANRNYWLVIHVEPHPSVTLDEDGLERDLSAWLASLDPDGIAVPWPVREWRQGRLSVLVAAQRKGEGLRSTAVPVVANPTPDFTYWIS
jgi:hypothetical protein